MFSKIFVSFVKRNKSTCIIHRYIWYTCIHLPCVAISFKLGTIIATKWVVGTNMDAYLSIWTLKFKWQWMIGNDDVLHRFGDLIVLSSLRLFFFFHWIYSSTRLGPYQLCISIFKFDYCIPPLKEVIAPVAHLFSAGPCHSIYNWQGPTLYLRWRAVLSAKGKSTPSFHAKCHSFHTSCHAKNAKNSAAQKSQSLLNVQNETSSIFMYFLFFYIDGWIFFYHVQVGHYIQMYIDHFLCHLIFHVWTFMFTRGCHGVYTAAQKRTSQHAESRKAKVSWLMHPT